MANPQVGAVMEGIAGLAMGSRGTGDEANAEANAGANLSALMQGLLGSVEGTGGGEGGLADVATALYVRRLPGLSKNPYHILRAHQICHALSGSVSSLPRHRRQRTIPATQ